MTIRIRGWIRSMSPQLGIIAGASLLALIVLLLLILTDTVGIPAAIITAAIPVSLGLVGQFVSSDSQSKREVEAKLRERKSAVYEAFIKMWMDQFTPYANRNVSGAASKELLKEMHGVSKSMMLWASNDVVRAWAEFRRRSVQPSNESNKQSAFDNLLHFEKTLFLMREDMGHDPRGFRQLDLLSFFVNDIHLYERSEGGVWQKVEQGSLQQ